jgi:hypothetical protein
LVKSWQTCIFLNDSRYTNMIPEKYLMPSDESIRYLTRRIEVLGYIMTMAKYLVLLLLPALILLYKNTTATEYFFLIFGFFFNCAAWLIATRKRNFLKMDLSVYTWLFDLMSYPDKIQHDKYFKEDSFKL